MSKIKKRRVRRKGDSKVDSSKNNSSSFSDEWPWSDKQSWEARQSDKENVPKLLDRLIELGIVHISESKKSVFFYPVKNTRPMLIFEQGIGKLPQFDRVQPFHVYDTVNYLMWERFLEPDLALSYKGLFDSMPMPDGKSYYLSSSLSDPAFDYMCSCFE